MVVKNRPDGVQLYLVIDEASAPTTYRFPFALPAGAELRLSPDGDGSVSIVERATGIEIAEVQPPWAEDADGRTVPTRFSIEGNTLVQEVDHEGATYPVVADPDVVLYQADRGNRCFTVSAGARQPFGSVAQSNQYCNVK
ncbi:hypothetical protein BH20ACT2_BH20ACT2_03090 [soil metagenome]